MAEKPNDIEAIYNSALKKRAEAERSAYLDAVCGDDAVLRARVESLVKAHEEAGDFLEVPAVGPNATLDGPAQIEGPGTMIGRYELLELIGEGGMGLVYLAEQQEPLRRRVALKIVKLGMDTKQVIARFEAERQALALLDHPNISHVFDAGTTKAGRPYFVMEYVEGVSITKYCDEQKLNIEERLELFKQVCEGVQHAHQKGIIHRDIKPSNILISNHGDKAVPKIIDFGIAKAITQPLTEETFFTRQGQLLGTPEYMSPEQVDLATEDIDTRSDIYSLGVLLYVLLSGALPFDRESLEKAGFAEIQRTIREEEPPLPSTRLTSLGDKAEVIAENRRTQIITLTRRLHRELEWIPMKAMRKDRTRRYRSASELSDDIQNYLNGAPLIAGPESAVYRTRKFVRKHAGSVATVALVGVVIVLGLVASSAMAYKAEQARQNEAVARAQAQQERKAAEEQSEEYRRLLYIHKMALAEVKYRDRNLRVARRLLKSCPEDLRNWEWDRLDYVMDEAPMTLEAGANCAAFSSDGRYIATGNYQAQTGSFPIIIWDAATAARIRTLEGHKEKMVVSVAFSPDGERIASGCCDHTIKIWDVNTGDELMTLRGHGSTVRSVAFSPDGKQIISGGFDSTIRFWDASTGEALRVLSIQKGIVMCAILSPDGKEVASASYDQTVKIWDAATGQELRSFQVVADEKIAAVSYSPDGKRLAVSSDKGTIKVLDALTGAQISAPKGHARGEAVLSVAFSPDGTRIVTGSFDNTVKVWDATTGEELTTLVGHARPVISVAFSPDGRSVVSAALMGGTAKIWDVDTDKEATKLQGHNSFVRDVAFSPDGKRLVSGSMDKTVKVWDVSEVKEIATLVGHEGEVWCVAISPSGKHVVSGSSDKTLRIWDISTGQEIKKLSGHTKVIYSVAFSADGQHIVSASNDGTAKIWDAATGEEMMTLSGHKSGVHSAAFSPDGKWIAIGDAVWVDAKIRIFSQESDKELKSLCGHKGPISSLRFTADSRQLASASYDETIRIWDVAAGTECRTLYGHKKCVESVAISPDGTRIVSGGFISARLWDLATGDELMTLPAVTSNGALGVAFSPDGRTIAGACDKDVILWQSAPR